MYVEVPTASAVYSAAHGRMDEDPVIEQRADPSRHDAPTNGVVNRGERANWSVRFTEHRRRILEKAVAMNREPEERESQTTPPPPDFSISTPGPTTNEFVAPQSAPASPSALPPQTPATSPSALPPRSSPAPAPRPRNPKHFGIETPARDNSATRPPIALPGVRLVAVMQEAERRRAAEPAPRAPGLVTNREGIILPVRT